MAAEPSAPEIENPLLRRMHDLRWPNGFECTCGRRTARLQESERSLVYVCSCAKRTSLTAGTMLGNSNLPPKIWWRAIKLYARLGRNLTTRRLAAHLGLSVKVAWSVIDKIERARNQLMAPALSSTPKDVRFDFFTGKRQGKIVNFAVIETIDYDGNKATRFFNMPKQSTQAVAYLLRPYARTGIEIHLGRNAGAKFRAKPIANLNIGCWGANQYNTLEKVRAPTRTRPGPDPYGADFWKEAAFNELGRSFTQAELILKAILEPCSIREQYRIAAKYIPIPEIINPVKTISYEQIKQLDFAFFTD